MFCSSLVETAQTWLAYRMLFSIWNKDAQILEHFRDGLRVVAGLVPETDRDSYLDRLRNNAYDLFAEFVYEEERASGDVEMTPRLDLFNFDVNDSEAPHFPVPVLWRRELQDFDPIHRPEAETKDGLVAFDELTKYVEQCLPPRPEGVAVMSKTVDPVAIRSAIFGFNPSGRVCRRRAGSTLSVPARQSLPGPRP